jgi:adenosylcobinamide-GDP ribazoletransferase
MIRGFFLQIMFLTRVPLPVKIEFNEADFVKGIPFAPVSGVLIGILPAAAFYLLSNAGLIYPAAASAITLQVMMTGGLHLDGLADTADGFFSCREKEKILEIMKDSRIGTNGALAVIILIMIKFSILVSINTEYAVYYLVAVPVAARMTITWCAAVSSYARPGNGMGKSIVEGSGIRSVVVSTIVAFVITVAIFRFRIILLPVLVLSSAGCFALLCSLYSSRKIRGITGDVIGAVVEVTEIIIYALLLALETIPVSGGVLP